MPTEIQWRLRESERQKKDDARWRTHSTVPTAEAHATVERWNYNAVFFEYRVGGDGKEKPKQGPFGFDFRKKGVKVKSAP